MNMKACFGIVVLALFFPSFRAQQDWKDLQQYAKNFNEGLEVDQETAIEDPCSEVDCSKVKRAPKGSWCHVREGKGNKKEAECVCPTECENEIAPVCSVFGRQHDSLCQLHKYACEKRKHIGVAYHTKCVASQEPCTGEEMAQFPHRLLEWFLHLKEIDEFGSLNPKTSTNKLTNEQREEVARWKFDQLDRKDDDNLNRRDLREFRYSLMPLEHCADPFFRKCDENKDKSLSVEEWYTCLKVHQGNESESKEVEEDEL